MTAAPIRPTIAELVLGYVTPPAAVSKRKAVHFIVEMRLSSRNARGHGNRAARRAKQLLKQPNNIT